MFRHDHYDLVEQALAPPVVESAREVIAEVEKLFGEDYRALAAARDCSHT